MGGWVQGDWIFGCCEMSAFSGGNGDVKVVLWKLKKSVVESVCIKSVY